MIPKEESMHVEQKQENSVEGNAPQQSARNDAEKSELIKIESISEAEKQSTHPGNPLKKRKIAMYLAYVGHDYQGMQRNPGAKTIEDELFRAIHTAGGISDSNADEKGFLKVCLFVLLGFSPGHNDWLSRRFILRNDNGDSYQRRTMMECIF